MIFKNLKYTLFYATTHNLHNGIFLLNEHQAHHHDKYCNSSMPCTEIEAYNFQLSLVLEKLN